MYSTERNNAAPVVGSSTRSGAESSSIDQASPQTDKKFVVRKLERRQPAQQSSEDGMTRLLDWRTQVRQRPAAVSVGALSIGLLTGYCIGGTLMNRKGGRSSSATGSSMSDTTSMQLSSTQSSSASAVSKLPAYTPEAAEQVQDSAYGVSGQEQTSSHDASQSSLNSSTTDEALQTMPDYPPSYGKDYKDKSGTKPRRAKPQRKESKLFAKFKQTSAFDRLQTEVSKISNQLINQLSDVGHNTVLPAITDKANQIFGGQPAPQNQGRGNGGAESSSLR